MRRGLCLLLVLALSGCGVQFAYSNLDWLLIDYIEGYVDLERDQKSILTQRIEGLKAWHQEEEIPLYIEHIDEMIAIDPKTFDEDAFLAQEEKMQHHSERIVHKIAPDLYSLSTLLTDEQAKELIESVEKRHDKFRKKYEELDEAGFRELYLERIIENSEKWIGALSDEQQQLAVEWSQKVKPSAEDWIKHQTYMRSVMKDLIDRRHDSGYFQVNFQRIMYEPKSYYSEALREKTIYNRMVAKAYVVKMVNSMSNAQVEHFHEELRDWRDIAIDIAQAAK